MDATPSKSFPAWSARQVVVATLIVVAVGVSFWFLFQYRAVILILFTAIILGTALRPMVQWFVRRGLSRAYALTAVYLLLLAGLSAMLLIVVPILARQSLELAASVPSMYQSLRTVLVESSSVFLRNLGVYLPKDLNLILNAAPAQSEPLDAVTRFFGFSNYLLRGFLAIVAVFLLTSFWIMESERTLRGLLLYLPTRLRQSAHELWEAIEIRVGAFVRGQAILSLTIGGVSLIAYLIIGLPNALVLALIAGILEAVPVFGPTLGAIPAMLVAYALDPTLAVWVLLATAIIQGLENYLLVPRIMGASVGVNPIITLLALATFASLLGLPGALLAIPSAAIIQLLLDRFVLSPNQNGWSALAGRDLNQRAALRSPRFNDRCTQTTAQKRRPLQ